jgi:hypothetical protein
MATYKRKPYKVEAWQFDGTEECMRQIEENFWVSPIHVDYDEAGIAVRFYYYFDEEPHEIHKSDFIVKESSEQCKAYCEEYFEENFELL